MYRIKTYRIMTLVSRYVSYRKVGVSLQPYYTNIAYYSIPDEGFLCLVTLLTISV